ncbi:cytochrome P450 [Flavisphingomonas formosensis]|uniref:cytochrome P450 n=1 Tax=Flavisphingomonas formosensis TaxID=861534 RepID=UPI0018DF522A|nr:cytochrome P450 [Sphingomonas formosensis]
MTVEAELDFHMDIKGLGNNLVDRLDALRAVDPIYWSALNQAWLVTGHKEVLDGYYGRLPLSSVRLPYLAVAHLNAEERAQIPEVMSAPRHWLLNMDGDEHHRIRRLIQKAFGKPVVGAIRPDVQRYVQETLDAVAMVDGPVDFVEEVARIIPARMILKVLGFDDTLIARLQHWSICMNTTGNLNVPLPDLIEVDKVIGELRDLFNPMFEERRRNPGNDFISALVTAVDEGDTLTDEEMFGVCQITLIAGHDTTVNTMALGIAELARDPAAVATLRADPAFGTDKVMEIQRKAQMSTFMSRVVAEDFDWNGHKLSKGQFVLLCQGAANRDPAVFAQPDRFDFARSQQANMAFAPGLHHCIGHLLAKMVLGEFFPAFVNRFDFELVDERLDFSPTMAFRGLEALPIRLTERKPH